MKILLTSATSALGRVVAEGIGESHQLRLTDRRMAALAGEYVVSAHEHDAVHESGCTRDGCNSGGR